MTARSIGKFLPSLKLRLGTKAVICAILLIAVNTALVVGAAYWSLTPNSATGRCAKSRSICARWPGVCRDLQRREDHDEGRRRSPAPKLPRCPSSRTMRSSIARWAMSAATRPCSSLTRRATSSSAAPPTSRRRTATAPSAPSSPPTIPGRRSLRRGEAYKGPATLFGKTFMTAYYPIVNPAGKVIGMLYVGIPMAQFETMLAQAIENMAIAAGVAALLVLLLTMLIVRRVTKPLTSVTRLADGDRQRQYRRRDRLPRADGRDRRDRANASRCSRTTRSNAAACARSRLRPRLPPPSSANPSCAASSTSSRPASAASSTRC